MHPQLVQDARLRQRFEQEARVGPASRAITWCRCSPPGVDAETGYPFLVMELLKGEDLGAALSPAGRLQPGETREIFGQLCHALAAAHAVGIVHRDLKPDNIFLAASHREGSAFIVKVLDFGIAKVMAEAQTHATAALGTPLWMAPEQTAAGAKIGPQTDVWALGLIAFRMLTGRVYWASGNAEDATTAMLMREITWSRWRRRWSAPPPSAWPRSSAGLRRLVRPAASSAPPRPASPTRGRRGRRWSRCSAGGARPGSMPDQVPVAPTQSVEPPVARPAYSTAREHARGDGRTGDAAAHHLRSGSELRPGLRDDGPGLRERPHLPDPRDGRDRAGPLGHGAAAGGAAAAAHGQEEELARRPSSPPAGCCCSAPSGSSSTQVRSANDLGHCNGTASTAEEATDVAAACKRACRRRPLGVRHPRRARPALQAGRGPHRGGQGLDKKGCDGGEQRACRHYGAQIEKSDPKAARRSLHHPPATRATPARARCSACSTRRAAASPDDGARGPSRSTTRRARPRTSSAAPTSRSCCSRGSGCSRTRRAPRSSPRRPRWGLALACDPAHAKECIALRGHARHRHGRRQGGGARGGADEQGVRLRRAGRLRQPRRDDAAGGGRRPRLGQGARPPQEGRATPASRPPAPASASSRPR